MKETDINKWVTLLSEKQVREFISKTEDAGIIQKKGDW